MTEVGQKIKLLQGGDGGRGNTAFKTSTNQAPRKSEPGWPGEDMWIWLRLKLIADVGLLGLPNAGKSTFLSKVSRARPKVADYPFTTLHPNLGVVYQDQQEFVIADIPGLIEGASQGQGLGTRFLGHIERCGALLHLIDGSDENVVQAYKIIRNEVEKYGDKLANKQEVVVINKIDALIPEIITEMKKELKQVTDPTILTMSGVTGENIETVLRKLHKMIKQDKDKKIKQKEKEQRIEKSLATVKKIGVLGGSFNPAHNGHLEISCQTMEKLNLDEIWWIITSKNPFKDAKTYLSLDKRIKIAKEVIKDNKIKIHSFEEK